MMKPFFALMIIGCLAAIKVPVNIDSQQKVQQLTAEIDQLRRQVSQVEAELNKCRQKVARCNAKPQVNIGSSKN